MAIKYLDNEAEEAFEVGDKQFYRYYSLESAKLSLKSNSLWFSNPTEWDDPFEKLFIEAKYQHNGITKDFPLKNRLFCICITDEDNSLASWDAYSNNQTAIRFQLSSKELLQLLEAQSIYEVYIGKVRYRGTREIDGKNGPSDFDLNDLFNISLSEKHKISLLLLKRYAYRYEREFRIILVRKNQIKNLKGIKLTFDRNMVHELITEVKIGPSTKATEVEGLRNIFKSYGIKKVYKSRLKDPLEPRYYKLI